MALGDNAKEIKGQETKIQSTSGLSYYLDNDYLPKHITVDLGGQETVKVGENLSSRRQLKVLDEKGNTIEGFFTADEFVDQAQIFKNRVSEVKTPEGYEDLQSAQQQLADKVSPALFTKQIAGILGFERTAFKGEDEQRLKDQLPGIAEYLRDRCDFPAGFCEDLKNRPPKTELVDYVKSLVQKANAANDLERAHTEVQKQTKFSNVNRRNTAARDLAVLAGLSYLIPNTTSMTIRNGDQVMHGNFMEHAKGVSFRELMANKSYRAMISMSGSAVRQISDMQVYDLWIGNVDRHYENMLYTLEEGVGAEKILTGIQGIDNDASFGEIGSDIVTSDKKMYSHMSLINDIKVIDKRTAEKLKGIDIEEMDNVLRVCGLSMKEIQATNERLEAIRKHIDDPKKVTIVNSDAEWDAYVTEPSPKYRFLMSSGNDYLENSRWNIFYKVGNSVVEKFNHYESRSDAAKAFPAPEKKEIPVGKAINIQNRDSFEDHADGLERIMKELTRNLEALKKKNAASADISGNKQPSESSEVSIDTNFRGVSDKLNAAVALLRDKQKKKDLDNTDRSRIAAELIGLKDAANKYTKDKEPEADSAMKRIMLHAAKNIVAYADFAKEAVQLDAMEAEKNTASRALHEYRQNIINGVPRTKFTADNLTERLPRLNGRHTTFYSDMVNALGIVRNLPENAGEAQKLAAYEQLIEKANAYQIHKMPNGKERDFTGLKQKEKERVEFAENLVEFAEAHKKLMREQKEIVAKDYRLLDDFREKCRKLSQDLTENRISNKQFQDTENQIMLKNGLSTMLGISRDYGKDHMMQSVCGVLMNHGVRKCVNQYLKCYNKENGLSEQNAFKALGFNDKEAQIFKEIQEAGKEAVTNVKEKKQQKPAAGNRRPSQRNSEVKNEGITKRRFDYSNPI